MKLFNCKIRIRSIIALAVYYLFAQFLPNSYFPIIGQFCKKLRYWCVKYIFFECGKNVNVERRVNFGSGRNVIIGNNSGLGSHCVCPSNIQIGENVMMGPFVYIFLRNHKYDRLDIPMCQQGENIQKPVTIGNDCWIGAFVKILPGRIVSNGSIIAAGCVLTKDFPEYSIIGGNPSRLIKSRISNDKK